MNLRTNAFQGGLIVLTLSLLACPHLAVARDAERDSNLPRKTRIRFADGESIAGSLAPADASNAIGLQVPGFATPFEFPLSLVKSFDTAQEIGDGNVLGPTILELSNGDEISGQVLGWKEDILSFDTKLFGPVQIQADQISSISASVERGKILFRAPTDIDQWTLPTPGREFFVETGSLVSSQRAAKARIDARLPETCRIRIALSWNRNPSFELYLAGGETDAELLNAFRLETWDQKLTIVREIDNSADATILSSLNTGAGETEMEVFLDQTKGYLGVSLDDGTFGSLTLDPGDATPQTFFQIANYGKELRLDTFDVLEWDGNLPIRFQENVSSPDDAATATSTDGENNLTDGKEPTNDERIVYDRILGFSQTKRTVTVLIDDQEREISIDDVRLVSKSPSLAHSSRPATEDDSQSSDTETTQETASDIDDSDGTATDASFQVTLRCRGREIVSGKWITQREPNADQPLAYTLQPDWSAEPIDVPVDVLESLKGSPTKKQGSVANRQGLLRLPTMKITGCLIDADVSKIEHPNASCLAWQPRNSLTAAAILTSASGQIEYRTQFARANGAITARQLQAQQLRRGNGNGAQQQLEQRELVASFRVPQGLQLRSGDLFETSDETISDDGLHFQSSNTEVKFIANQNLQSLQLGPARRGVTLDEEKMNRLLTVPRMSQRDPPTHMLIATNGDFLRGRLLGMNEEFVTIEVRLAEINVPRSSVASIVWLHDRNWSNVIEKSNDKAQDSAPEKNVTEGNTTQENLANQTRQTAGTLNNDDSANPEAAAEKFIIHLASNSSGRMTCEPIRVKDGIVFGRSDVIASCQKPLDKVDSLLFGNDASEQAREMYGNPWVLELATMPAVFADNGQSDASGSAGNLHPLVGQPAPNFRLDSMDDSKVTLGDEKGKILIVDFWASWCGPCIQAMPTVKAVADDFADQNVQLYAVNLQENPEKVALAAARLGLADSEILLDTTGGVATEYQATAIPQTVIIDAEGIIRNVFVGGSNRLDAELRAALEEAQTPFQPVDLNGDDDLNGDLDGDLDGDEQN